MTKGDKGAAGAGRAGQAPLRSPCAVAARSRTPGKGHGTSPRRDVVPEKQPGLQRPAGSPGSPGSSRDACGMRQRRQPGRAGAGRNSRSLGSSLLARLEKLLIEFLSLPSPPCSSAEKHPGSQPCPFAVTLPANSAQEFLQALCTWKKGWGGDSRELGRGCWSLGFKSQIHQLPLSASSPSLPPKKPTEPMNCKFRFIVLSPFLQCYRLISLSDGMTNFKTLKIDVTDWFKGNCFV